MHTGKFPVYGKVLYNNRGGFTGSIIQWQRFMQHSRCLTGRTVILYKYFLLPVNIV